MKLALYSIAKFALCAMVLAGPVCSGMADEGNGFLARDIQAHLLVHDPESTIQRLVEWAEERGGYFVYRSLQRVELRIPSRYSSEVRLLTEEIGEEVIDLTIEARDLRQRMLQVNAGIKSRREILSRNLAHLRRADLESALAIEQEVSRLMEEIERLEGELRRLQRDISFARVEMNLTFQGQELPVDIPSSFAWIDQVDFYRYMEETGR